MTVLPRTPEPDGRLTSPLHLPARETAFRVPSLLSPLKPWPVLILRLKGDADDDGEERLIPATMGVVPPERLEPSAEVPGAYIRHPEVSEPWTWRYLWVAEDDREHA
jgi:hypothetical protein